jgi:hypothetical protein
MIEQKTQFLEAKVEKTKIGSIAVYFITGVLIALGFSAPSYGDDSIRNCANGLMDYWGFRPGELGADRQLEIATSVCKRHLSENRDPRDQSISAQAAAKISQSPTSIQAHVLQVVMDNCDGSGGKGESRVLKPISAKDRASQMAIPVKQAMQVNEFLLQINQPCSPVLKPAVLKEDRQPDYSATTAI